MEARVHGPIRDADGQKTARSEASPRLIGHGARIAELVERVPDRQCVHDVIDRKIAKLSVVNVRPLLAGERVHSGIEVEPLEAETSVVRSDQKRSDIAADLEPFSAATDQAADAACLR